MVVIRTSYGVSVFLVQFLLNGGRYWDRTSDPFHVKEVRYRCANRPFLLSCDVAVKCIEVETGFEPV